MNLKIQVYLTTRTDPVDDLDTIQSLGELKSWRKNIKPHAVKIFEYNEVGDQMIMDLMDFTIQECYALVACPPEKLYDASGEVGEMLLQFLKDNSQKLKWDLKETGSSSTSVGELAEKHRFIDPSRLWENFTYSLVSDKNLKEDEYEIDLEVVVEPDETEH